MSSIGFELLTERALRILPDSSFSIAIIWNGVKITSSIGKDYYNQHNLILSKRRITATGRLHHLTTKLPFFQGTALQVSPCRLIPCPTDPLEELKIEITLPQPDMLDPLYRNGSLLFYKESGTKISKYNLYFDPRSIEEIQSNQYVIDLSHIIPKHFSSCSKV